MGSQAMSVEDLLRLLDSDVPAERRRAAAGLREAGARRPGRGSARATALFAVPPPEAGFDLSAVIRATTDPHWETRKEAACALGEWAAEGSLEALERMARTDPEWRVRDAVAAALAQIGGQPAIDVLLFMARSDPHPRPAVRACRALGELAAAAWPNEVGPQSPAAAPSVRTRGAVRVRGARAERRLHPCAEAILGALDQIRFSHSDPEVRRAAEETLGSLDR